MQSRAEGRLDRLDLDRRERRERRSDAYRRIFDITVSLVLGLMVLPIVLLAAAGSAISLRAWPFFVQERVGRGGQLFHFVKVRTLPPDAPSYTDKHQLKHVDIPPFCAALRRLHLDELPQLWLVLRGHMSLVGPRPEMAYLHEQLAPAFAERRTATRPGCTGLWQVSEACDDLIGAAPEYDDFYLAHRSLRLDLWVLVRTAAVMTGLAQTVRLADVPGWIASDLGTVIDLTEAATDPLRELAASQAT